MDITDVPACTGSLFRLVLKGVPADAFEELTVELGVGLSKMDGMVMEYCGGL